MAGDRLKMVFFAILLSALVVVVITICIIFIPSRPCVQIDAIEVLQTVQIEDRLLVTWAQPVGQGDCSMTYRIQLSNGTDVIEEVVTTETNVEFLNVSIAPCLSSIVSVYAFTHSRFGSTITGSVNDFNHFGTIGPVTNLQVLQENSALSANWGPPEDSELCSLSYEVTLQTHQEEIQETNVITETSFVFEQVDTRPCAAKTIVVTPLGVLVGEENLRGEEVIHVHFSELGPVENLELEVLEGTSLVIDWNSPLDTVECQLAYQVTLNFQGEFIQDDVIQVNHHSFVIPDVAACGISNVSVTPIANVSNEEVRGLELHVFHVNELGSVLNLVLSRQGNGLLAVWEAPPNSEICGAITYGVVLQSSGGAIREEDYIDENQFVFEQADLTPCTISIITVIPLAMTSGDEFQIRGEANADMYFAGIGAVENLVIAPAEGGLMVNWAAPLVAADCPLSYEVTLWHDGDVSEIATTYNLGLAFENADVRPCVINEVSVIPIARKDLHEGKGEETRGSHFGEIGLVTNFELALDEGNHLVARWNAPIDSEVCELVYEILLESNEPVPLQIITESHFEHVFTELELQPCVLYTVTVTPTVIIDGDLQRGQQDTLTYFADIGPVEGLEVNQNGAYLSVNWARPVQSELCAQVLYEVTLTLGELVLDPVQTGAETHTFTQLNLQPCTESHVSVIPIVSNQDLETRGPEVSQRHFAAVGPVQNLEFQMEPFGISWSEPVDSDACDLIYQILIESRGTTTTIDNFYSLEDLPCYHYIATVTPLVQEAQSGAPQTKAHEIPPADEIGPVQNLRFSYNSFEWDPPINSGVCLVRYDLAMTINGVPVSNETFDLFFGATPCSTVSIEVRAFLEGHTSTPVASELVEVPLLSLGAVENLAFLDDRVQWEKPPDAGNCVVVYELTHTSGSESHHPVTLSQTYFLIDLKFCSHHEVSVYAHYEGENEEESISGAATSLQETVRFPGTPDEIGQVENLRVTSGGLVEWSPPISVEMCPVVYLIHVDRIFDQIHHSQDYTQFQIENIPCSNNKLSVNPLVNDVSGFAEEISHTVALSFDIDAPVILTYIATHNSVSSVWRAPGMTINSCTITQFSVFIEGENANPQNNFQTPVIDNALRKIDLEIGKLFPETDYSISTSIHVLGFPSPGIASEPLLFRTEPAPPGWDDEDTVVDNVKLKSDTPSDSTVSGYKVVIHNNY